MTKQFVVLANSGVREERSSGGTVLAVIFSMSCRMYGQSIFPCVGIIMPYPIAARRLSVLVKVLDSAVRVIRNVLRQISVLLASQKPSSLHCRAIWVNKFCTCLLIFLVSGESIISGTSR